jgi:RNA polymerase sigma-70 factor (ECF subfamily)
MIFQKELSFESYFKEIKGDLFGRLVKRSINPADAEDIIQKAALKMWQKYDTFSEGTSFKAWAWTVTLNTMLNFLRSKRRSVVLHGEDLPDVFEDATAPGERQEDPRLLHMEELLNRLSASETRLLVAVYVEGKKIKEYAEENNIAKSTCFNTISLIRKKLKEQINERILLEMH